MRSFTMNLLRYNAQTAFPNGGIVTQKQTDLANEIQLYAAGLNPVNIAGFTEVFAANTTPAADASNALNNLGGALNIPALGGVRHIALIRCGYSALQPNGTEVIAIVLDGNAANVDYYVASFEPGGPDYLDVITPAPGAPYVAFLDRIRSWTLDYRYIVGARFTLGVNAQPYNIGFLHNRRPGTVEGGVTMERVRQRFVKPDSVNLLLGGDFNTNPACGATMGVPTTCDQGSTLRTQRTYYSTGGVTTNAVVQWNNYDWWMSRNSIQINGANVLCDATPTFPNPLITGSDHRGVGIVIP